MYTAAGVRADRPPPHAHVRHDVRAARRGRGDDPQQRPRQPAGRVLGRGPFTPRTSSTRAWWPTRTTCSTARSPPRAACALLLTTAERAADLRRPPVYVLGGGVDHTGPSYQHPPAFDLAVTGRAHPPTAGSAGAAAERSFSMAGLSPADVDVAELYDPFSFEIIRQLEAFGFCAEGEGGAFVADGNIRPGWQPADHDRRRAAVVQPRRRHRAAAPAGDPRRSAAAGICATTQIAGAEVALGSNGGAGALFNDVVLLGSTRR